MNMLQFFAGPMGGGISQSSYWATLTRYDIGGLKKNEDTDLRSSTPNTVRNSTTVSVIGEEAGASRIFRTLLNFDRSQFVSSVNYASVKLRIYLTVDVATNDTVLNVYKLKKQWSETQATWNSRLTGIAWTTPGAFHIDDCEQTPIGSISIPNNALVNQWYEIPLNISNYDDIPEYGFLLKTTVENDDGWVMAGGFEIQTMPQLLVEYTLSNPSPLFDKSAANPLFKGVFGSVVKDGNNLYYYYGKAGGSTIYRRSSSDGLTWSAETTVMQSLGFKVEVAQAWKEGEAWFLLYRSNEWGGFKAIGLAYSTDGVTWTKEVTNPIITNTDIGAWCPSDIDPYGIIKVGDTYHLFVNNVNTLPRKTGVCTSTDLITWTMNPSNPIITNGYCAQPIKYDGYYYLFACKLNDTISTDGPNYSTIALYRDINPTFLPDSREYLGIVLAGAESYDIKYLDTPSIVTQDITRVVGDELLYMFYTGGSGTEYDWDTCLATKHSTMLKYL